MTKTVRDVLRKIEDVLLKSDGDDADDLWSVMTALRGPDNGNFDLKERYTIPIRRLAFPRLARRREQKTGAVFEGTSQLHIVNFGRTRRSHYLYHIYKAQQVLKP